MIHLYLFYVLTFTSCDACNGRGRVTEEYGAETFLTECGKCYGRGHFMSEKQFKKRWDSNEDGGGITFDDIAECAIKWGICDRPRVRPIDEIADKVLKAAGCARTDR